MAKERDTAPEGEPARSGRLPLTGDRAPAGAGRHAKAPEASPAGAVRGGSLPCDLPLDGGRIPSLATLFRRYRVFRVVCLCLLAAIAALAVVLAVRACAPSQPEGVEDGVVSGTDAFFAGATAVSADVLDRAQRGVGAITGVVCIDAGHGGGADLTLTPIGPGSSEMQNVEPGGTSGVVTGRDEAEVNLEIALRLKEKLVDAGVTVVMVREDNETVLSSEQRAQIANAAGADLFVRLHCDGSDDPSTYGFSTLIPGYNEWTAGIVESSAYAASIMHPIIIAESGANDAGIVERYDLAGFNFCAVPSVLFEMGFMSNPDEDVLLSDPTYQDTLAQAICDGVLAYLEAVSG